MLWILTPKLLKEVEKQAISLINSIQVYTAIHPAVIEFFRWRNGTPMMYKVLGDMPFDIMRCFEHLVNKIGHGNPLAINDQHQAAVDAELHRQYKSMGWEE